ncbi:MULTISPECIES: hypothetical protein [unclassified Candidatus Tisiphia]|uniref:hypothetical protein n=1 Tax=unclassified Candidatus Tisiphia TaxID=2996318 RepID=UPI0035C8ED10
MNKKAIKYGLQLALVEQAPDEFYQSNKSDHEQRDKKIAEGVMSKCLINQFILAQLVKNELQAKLTDQLMAIFGLNIQEFGYRQFLSDGTTIGFCTRNIDNIKNTQSKNLGYEYETLRRFYNQETCNSFIIYQRTKDKIEGFYFLSSSNNSEIISYYINHLESFEQFINIVSLYVSIVLSSIRCNNSYCETLQHNDLYVKIFSQNSLDELFPAKLSSSN